MFLLLAQNTYSILIRTVEFLNKVLYGAYMRPHVLELKKFYQSPCGVTTQRMMALSILDLWPSLSGEILLGIGFSTPVLEIFNKESERSLALMSVGQGVIQWPSNGKSLTTISEESAAPFSDNSIDRILLIHALELSNDRNQMMEEVWRILKPSGRVLFVVPNRRALWSRAESTPFGQGFPFTSFQLNQLLLHHRFISLRQTATLYFPPIQSSLVVKTVALWQWIGKHFARPFGGVLIVEAQKDMFALSNVNKKIEKKKLLSVPSAALPA